MPSSQPILEPANPGDAEALAALRDEAAAWLLEQGYVQWIPGEFDAERYARSIDQDEVLVVRDDGQIVATVTVASNDELIWADRHRPDAVYIHRLIVARSRSGRGLGTAVLREVERRARARGRRLLRLDIVELNADLAAYYERHGFRPVGRQHYPPHLGFHPSLLMEKIVIDGNQTS
ncbi:GNAT family N-acetyltransferase [Flindersiella endophytica]